LEQIFDDIKPFLPPEGIKATKKQDTSVRGLELEMETTLVEGKECTYVIFDQNGSTKCGIEKIWEQGAVDFRKPISCHLYPIRIT
jgi:hypothetical protein